jgi:hypothetical protein
MDIKLELVFSEEKKPYLLDISSLLYDFELLHDFSLVICAEEYSEYRFSRYFWYRNGRPIKPTHKIRASRIVKESPLTVELVLAGITALSGAFWVLVQAMEKIRNWKLNKEKLKQEVEKLRLENQIKRVELEQKVQEKEAFEIFTSLMNRFESNPISLVDIHISIEKTKEEKFEFR